MTDIIQRKVTMNNGNSKISFEHFQYDAELISQFDENCYL